MTQRRGAMRGMRFQRALVAVIVVALLAAACGDPSPGNAPAASPTPDEPEFEATFAYDSCGFDLPEGQVEGETITCGTLTVPEDRTDDASRTIELAVAVLNAIDDEHEPDPLIYLSGGPGGPALEYDIEQFTADFAAPVQLHRDIVFFDQRGVGRSDPALDCPEVEDLYVADLPEDEETATDPYDDALFACRERLRDEGADLDAYNSAENAADIASLAGALEYETYNLYGVSYGTRLALTAMRDAPERIRSVILDSVVPLQADIYADGAITFEESLQAMFDACAADAACRSFAPGLQTTFFSLVAKLDGDPVTVEAYDVYGDAFDLEVNGDDLLGFFFQALYDTSYLPYMPGDIVLIDDGDNAPLELLASYFEFAADGTSLGMHLSVQCSEEIPFNVRERIAPARNRAFDRLHSTAEDDVDFARADCAIWDVRRSRDVENAPVESDIPALLLSGQFDPVTPASYAREAAATLSNGYAYTLPGYGHGVWYEGCATDMIVEFLADPSHAPDASCIADMPLVEFVSPYE